MLGGPTLGYIIVMIVHSSASKLPRGCVEEWRAQADKHGYLNWEGFSTGLAQALKADSARLKAAFSSSCTDAKRKQDSSKVVGLGVSMLTNPIEASEIEAFLTQCNRSSLVQALTRTKKEVYRCQVNLQTMIDAADSSSVSGKGFM